MDKKPFRPNQKGNSKGGRSYKNAGFIALVILFALVVFAAYNQPSTLKTIPLTQAVADSNSGKYQKININGN